MRVYKTIFSSLVVLFLALPVFAQQGGQVVQAGTTHVFWRDPGDISSRNLIDGAGGKAHAPGTKFKFIKEVRGGSNPKFDVEDDQGVTWRVKLGVEAKPETAATRLLWAVGYFVDEDYYLPAIRVEGIKQLSRGQKYVSEDGVVRSVRLELGRKDGKKLGTWSWFENPFVGTKEFNGLRVMMALINDWDLHRYNNSIYEETAGERRYVVSDPGACFGKTGNNFTRSKGNLADYREAKFVKKVTPDYVDLVIHSRPFILGIFDIPNYITRTRMEKVAKRIPRAEAKWIGDKLGQLSSEQIGDCFRAAGFSPAEVEGYTGVVMQRIEALKKL